MAAIDQDLIDSLREVTRAANEAKAALRGVQRGGVGTGGASLSGAGAGASLSGAGQGASVAPPVIGGSRQGMPVKGKGAVGTVNRGPVPSARGKNLGAHSGSSQQLNRELAPAFGKFAETSASMSSIGRNLASGRTMEAALSALPLLRTNKTFWAKFGKGAMIGGAGIIGVVRGMEAMKKFGEGDVGGGFAEIGQAAAAGAEFKLLYDMSKMQQMQTAVKGLQSARSVGIGVDAAMLGGEVAWEVRQGRKIADLKRVSDIFSGAKGITNMAAVTRIQKQLIASGMDIDKAAKMAVRQFEKSLGRKVAVEAAGVVAGEVAWSARSPVLKGVKYAGGAAVSAGKGLLTKTAGVIAGTAATAYAGSKMAGAFAAVKGAIATLGVGAVIGITLPALATYLAGRHIIKSFRGDHRQQFSDLFHKMAADVVSIAPRTVRHVNGQVFLEPAGKTVISDYEKLAQDAYMQSDQWYSLYMGSEIAGGWDWLFGTNYVKRGAGKIITDAKEALAGFEDQYYALAQNGNFAEIYKLARAYTDKLAGVDNVTNEMAMKIVGAHLRRFNNAMDVYREHDKVLEANKLWSRANKAAPEPMYEEKWWE